MTTFFYRLYAPSLAWLVVLAAVTHSLVLVPLGGTDHGAVADLALFLVPAIAAAWLATPGSTRPIARLSPAFVLAAWAAIPGPAGLWIALAAALPTLGGGVGGPYRRGTAVLAGVAVAGSVGQFFAGPLLDCTPWSAILLLRLGLIYAVFQGLAFAMALVLDLDLADSLLDRDGPGWRTALIEVANVPLAWLLVGLVASGARLPAAAVAALALAALGVLRRLDRALAEQRRTNAALSERLGELAALQAVGRAILSSTDPARIFPALERECRAIFPIDFCSVLLAEERTARLRTIYRHRRGERPDATDCEPAGLALEAFAGRASRRIDDLGILPSHSPLLAGLEARGGSAMAAPLLVDGHPIGVLCVQARSQAAYDEHALSVFDTIAQQVAVAVENARHFRMATVDSLTGFFMRDYFFSRLDEERERVRRYGGRFGLLMVDVDGFKQVNDRNGHLAGDHHLREIAATIRTQLRAADVACRYGGDEFCLLLPETDLAGAQAIAERVREAVARRLVAADGSSLGGTVSIGVAACPQHDTGDLRDLLRAADGALYRAKAAGRDRVVPFAA